MKNRKCVCIGVAVLTILGCLCTTGIVLGKNNQKNEIETTDEVEYWALIVGVSKVDGVPEADLILSFNGQSGNELKDLLLKSDNWQEDNIKLLTGEEATTFNIMKGLKWLAKNADENDICLFYMGSMGLQMRDFFPRDESDGYDECLITYNTFRLKIPLPWIHMLYDDQINFFLNKIDAQGICVIIESEYSGGYNDIFSSLINNNILDYKKDKLGYAEKSKIFNENIAKDLQKKGRVVISSCEESSYFNLNWVLIHDMMSGFQGFADSNDDGQVSIEEAYNYGSSITIEKCEREFLFSIRPQIFDNYDGEMILTKSQYPPEKPTFIGPTIGNLNVEESFTISSSDPENDPIKYYIDWGDGTKDWTDFYESGEEAVLTHSWDESGTYTIYFECVDEHDSKIYAFPMMDRTVISIIDDEIIDQKMTDRYEGQVCNWGLFGAPQGFAQSFVPQKSVLTKLDLQMGIIPGMSQKSLPVYISIREKLSGADIVKVSVTPKECNEFLYLPVTPKTPWITVDFPDTELIPGEKYYIVARYAEQGAVSAWDHSGKFYFDDPDYAGDSYLDGEAYISYENQWEPFTYAYDFCFVTYGI